MVVGSGPLRLRALVSFAVAAVLGAFTAAPAMGQGYQVADPVGDQVSYSDSFDSQGHQTSTGPTAEPAHSDGDISGFAVDHRRHRLVATVAMVDFTVPPSTSTSSSETDSFGAVVMEIQTRSPRRTYEAVGVSDGTQGIWMLSRDRGRHHSHPVRCRGFQHAMRPDHTVSFSIPRRCLGAPRLVRVGAGSALATITGTDAAVSQLTYVDDAQTVGVQNPDSVVYGPWLRRG